MNSITFIVICVTSLFIINLLRYFYARRQRRGAEAKLRIARLITKMEILMRDGSVTGGELCHDLFPRLMFKNQTNNYKLTLKGLLTTPPKEVKQLINKFEKELMQKDGEIQKLVSQFLDASFLSFRYSQPILFWLMAVPAVWYLSKITLRYLKERAGSYRGVVLRVLEKSKEKGGEVCLIYSNPDMFLSKAV